MRITENTLRKMIIQEMRNVRRQKRLQEGTAERPIAVTPQLLNRIIREEYTRFQRRQRLTEAKRRRLAAAKRRR
jgi:hypothetical protein